jgi:hypothetical protein
MISWTDRLRNEVAERVKEERKILQTIQRKEDWSHRVRELPSKTRHSRKNRGENKSDGKARIKTWAASV